jgi:hypothetical protein
MVSSVYRRNNRGKHFPFIEIQKQKEHFINPEVRSLITDGH